MKQKYQKFKNLLSLAIGTRTQNQFAKETGISPEHINRMMNLEKINRPSNLTLHKIASAAASGVSYNMLKEALDLDEPAEKDNYVDPIAEGFERNWNMYFYENASEILKTLIEKVQKETYPSLWNTLENMLNHVIYNTLVQFTPGIKLEHEILKDETCDKNGPNEYADRQALIRFKLASNTQIMYTDMAAFYTELPVLNSTSYIVLQKTSFTIIDIAEAWDIPEDLKNTKAYQKSPNEVIDLPYFICIKPLPLYAETYTEIKNTEAFDNIGESDMIYNITYTKTIEGCGFYLEHIPKNLSALLQKHRNLLLEKAPEMPLDKTKKFIRIFRQALDENQKQKLP